MTRPAYCTSCGELKKPDSNYCIWCGKPFESHLSEDIQSLTYLLNELPEMLGKGMISQEQLVDIEQMYGRRLEALNQVLADKKVMSAHDDKVEQVSYPSSVSAPPLDPGVPAIKWTEIASWGAIQAPSLLLFVGAFLMVMAALIFVVTAGEDVSSTGKFVLVSGFTLGFLLAGAICYQFHRVILAGRVFLGIGAFLTPLVIASVHLFLLKGSAFPRDVLWLAGSAYTTMMYGAIALLRFGSLYSYLTGIALLIVWGSFAAVINVPVEWVPAMYVFLAGILSRPVWYQWRWSPLRFIKWDWILVHLVTPVALVVTVLYTTGTGEKDSNLWFLPATLAIGALFYGVLVRPYTLTRLTSLLLAGGALVGVVMAMDLGAEYYGAILAGLGVIYGAGWFLPFRRIWRWKLFLWPLGIVTVSMGSILFALVYVDHPVFGTLVFLAASAVYLVAAASLASWFPDITKMASSVQGWTKFVGVALLLAASVALSVSYYFVLHGVFELPARWIPASYVLLACVRELVFRLRLLSASRETLAPLAVFTHLVSVPAIAVVVGLAIMDVQDRWYLPVTLALAAVLYLIQRPQRTVTQIAALALMGGAVIGVVVALDVDTHYYGVTLVCVGLAYAVAWTVRRQWILTWRAPLWLLGVAAVTAGSVLFVPAYVDFPWFGASAFLTTSLVFVVASRLYTSWGEHILSKKYSVAVAVAKLYAGGMALAGAYYYLLLGALDPGDLDRVEEFAIAFFPMTIVLAVLAATSRWWHEAWKVHLYVMAVCLSIPVVAGSGSNEGAFFGFLAAYTALSIVGAVWEGKPLWGIFTFIYGFPTTIALARYMDFSKEYWPVTPAIAGVLLYATSISRERVGRWWDVARVGGLALVGVAAVESLILLIRTVDRLEPGIVDLVNMPIYLTLTVLIGLSTVLVLIESIRRADMALQLSAATLGLVTLMAAIGRFHPENIQIYSVPVGIYILAAAILLRRGAQRFPAEIRGLPSVLEFGAVLVIVVPGLLRSLGDEGYLIWVVGQTLALLVTGVVFQRRLVVSPAVVCIGIISFRVLIVAGQALPGWVSLGLGGIFLLSLGFLLLLGRNSWLRWQRFVVAMWRRWG